MTRRLVLHIGDHKTGSTSIQKQLVSLGAQGRIFYSAPRSHNRLANLLRSADTHEQGMERLRKMLGQFVRSDHELCVISAEAFEGMAPDRMAAILEKTVPKAEIGEIRIIAYVRPHAERLLSSYAEQVKDGLKTGALEEFFERTRDRRRFFYTPRFESWRTVFGDRFILRPMVRTALKEGDVVADFFSLLAITDLPAFETDRQNRSLSLEDLALVRHVQAAIPPRARMVHHPLGWHLQEILLAAAPRKTRTRLALHRSLYERVAETYRADAAALDAAFFEGRPMSDALAAAKDKVVERAQTLEAEAHFSPEELRLVDALSKVLAQVIASDPSAISGSLWRQLNFRPEQPKAGTPRAKSDENPAKTPASEHGSTP